MSCTCCSKVTLDFFLGVHVPLMALTNMWNQTYSKKRLLWTTLVSWYVSSSKMKLWHFIRSIENIRVGHQFTLGLAHQLQQMQNCMKYFNGCKGNKYQHSENFNVQMWVQRERMELAECPLAEDRVLILIFLPQKVFFCLPSVSFTKNPVRKYCKSRPDSGYWAHTDHHAGSIVGCIRLASQVQLMEFWIHACFFSRCLNNAKARVIIFSRNK